MEEFVYRPKSNKKLKGTKTQVPLYYYLKESGFTEYKTILEASKAFNLSVGTIETYLWKSKRQTVSEFLSDKSPNQFIWSSDPKIPELLKNHNLIILQHENIYSTKG